MSRSGQEAAPRTRLAVAALPDAAPVLGGATFALVATGLVAVRANMLPALALALAAIAWCIVCATVVGGLRHHPHRRFGAANTVTTARALVAVAFGALAVKASLTESWLWGATLVAVVTLALDGIDGPLARAAGLDSAFGARYDMETDALLALALATLIWRTGELGIWILALGTMRYVFIAAARIVPALNATLYPSVRRKTICVVQIAALCAIVSPIVRPPLAGIVGAVAIAALGWSFARDTRWLLRQAGKSA